MAEKNKSGAGENQSEQKKKGTKRKGLLARIVMGSEKKVGQGGK